MHYGKPTEPVWSNLKRSLANLTKHNIDQLTALVKTRLRRIQYRRGLLDGFLAKTGLDLGTLPASEDRLGRSAGTRPFR